MFSKERESLLGTTNLLEARLMSLPLAIGIYTMEERVTAGFITSVVKFCPLFSLNYPQCLRLSFNLGCVRIISA